MINFGLKTINVPQNNFNKYNNKTKMKKKVMGYNFLLGNFYLVEFTKNIK